MSDINENNLTPITQIDLKAGQRLIKRTAADGSVIFIAGGVGSFVAGGKVFVEAQTSFTDNTSTTATIDIAANRRYVFTQPLTSLTIQSVEDGALESEVQFATGSSIQVVLPASLAIVTEENFQPNKHYIISIKNNIAAIASYTPGE